MCWIRCHVEGRSCVGAAAPESEEVSGESFDPFFSPRKQVKPLKIEQQDDDAKSAVQLLGEIEILVKSTTALESARRRKLFASSLSSDGKNVETHIRRGSVIEFDLEKDDFEKEEDEPVKSESVQELKLEDLLDEDQVFFDETTPASLEHLKEVYEEKLEKRKALKSGLGPNDEELEVDFKNHLYGFLEKRVGEDTAKKKMDSFAEQIQEIDSYTVRETANVKAGMQKVASQEKKLALLNLVAVGKFYEISELLEQISMRKDYINSLREKINDLLTDSYTNILERRPLGWITGKVVPEPFTPRPELDLESLLAATYDPEMVDLYAKLHLNAPKLSKIFETAKTRRAVEHETEDDLGTQSSERGEKDEGGDTLKPKLEINQAGPSYSLSKKSRKESASSLLDSSRADKDSRERSKSLFSFKKKKK